MSKVVEQDSVEAGSDEEIVDVNAAEEEVVEAATEEAPSFEIPDKFRDKSIEDVVKSYQELEKAYGRSNNELGEIRKINQQLVELQLSDKPQEATESGETLDVDSLLDNPAEAISKAIESNPRLKKIEEALVKDTRDKAKSSFESRHPDWQEKAATQEFQDWIQGSPNRMQMFQQAHQNYDYGLAGELFDWYSQTHQPTKAVEADIDKATTEPGGARVPKRQKVFRRSDLERMRMYDRDRFDAMQDEIIKAYAEGRVR